MEKNKRTIICFIEIKKPNGRRRPAQIAWIEAARRDGVIAFFADSVEAMVKGFADYGIRLKGGIEGAGNSVVGCRSNCSKDDRLGCTPTIL